MSFIWDYVLVSRQIRTLQVTDVRERFCTYKLVSRAYYIILGDDQDTYTTGTTLASLLFIYVN